jgi:hypothetical protein
MNPTRFAIVASGALACLMLGLVVGVSAGSSHASHVLRVQTVTKAGPDTAVPAAARTVTATVVRTVHVTHTVTVPHTVVESVMVTAAAAPGPAHGHGHGHGDGPGHGHGPGGPGGGDGGGGDG